MSLPEPHAIRPPRWGKIHPWRRLIQVLTSALFILAPLVGLLRFDIPGSKLILLRSNFSLLELTPVLLLTLLTILLVFAGALIYGRLFCGWFCPQTTLSELAETFIRLFERRRKAPLWRRALARLAVVVLAGIVSASLVSYFLDPSRLLSPPLAAWVVWGVVTAGLTANLLWLRHRFCDGVCPYGILQSVVQDERTLGVCLDHNLLTVCLHCHSCIKACFMGLDIRRIAFDMQCVNCGDCIDSINRSHRRLDRPIVTGFRFGKGATPSAFPRFLQSVGISDWRRAAVVLAILAVSTTLAYLLFAPGTLEGRISPRFDRTTVDATGTVHNHYNLRLANHLDHGVDLKLSAQSKRLPDLQIVSPPGAPLHLDAGKRTTLQLVLRARRTNKNKGSHDIVLRIEDRTRKNTVTLRTKYFIPSPRSGPHRVR
jgi:polyferredoxin